MNTAALYKHRWTLVRMPLALFAIALTSAVWWLGFPMPPTRLSISTGLADGAYQLHALRYAEALARRGIQLDIQLSAGSPQNLERLQASPATADLALVQGGFGWSSAVGPGIPKAPVQTLANVDIEALWLFSKDVPLTTLAELDGLRVAAGPEGSGHRNQLRRLLAQERVPPEDIRWSDLSGLPARDALLRHEVDAVFMVSAPSSPGVEGLLAAPSLRLAMLQGTGAIAERNKYLESRLLPQDGMGTNLPSVDTSMLTTSTHLLAREGLHPALKRAVTAVALEVHGEGGPFHRAGEYPTLRASDFPSAPESRSVMLRGLNLFERHLPFWWAQVAERLLLIGLPVLLLTALLLLLVPAWLRWRLEGHVTRWYGELRFIEDELANQSLDVGGMELSHIHNRLRRMEAAIAAMQLPEELAQHWFTLRQHIEFVRSRILEYRGR
ncbi:MAG: TAXI family TRAP transporter solute-binding subunit [Hydrogenophaga sp.]|uniref:TAXI family TRAP transporter solute-binding subunit n=1 Tax=Hydrogenophaga sp. TaxID=1904254 RepID=UPI002721269A|nr:TAXI family TRAP transporter solute-binding subunit [Hydrogenophaga sp.]MDO9031861.1 TAXI family TRAP transporter solute-binding subunit [Hydrogenophaga sp.]